MLSYKALSFLLLSIVIPLLADEGAIIRSRTESAADRQRLAAGRQRVAAASAMAAVERQLRSVAVQLGTLASVPEFCARPGRTIAPMPAVPAGDSCERLPAGEARDLVDQTARQQGLPPELLREVVRVESNFRPCAVSPKGALGLMQLMPATVERFGVHDPFDPKENLESGAGFLRQLLVRYGGDLGLALAAYNAGPARVDQTRTIPALPETLQYVNRILTELEPKDAADLSPPEED